MPLHKRTLTHFQPGDRRRGEDYFRDGRVQLEVDGSRVRARVAGTDRPAYAVGLDWSRLTPKGGPLHAFCECQRFAAGEACKHVWAALLAVAEAAPDSEPPGGNRLAFRRDRASAWQDLGVAPDADALARHRAGRSRATRKRSPRSGRGAAGSWQAQIESIREAVEDAPAAPAAASGDDALAAVRLLINTAASQESAGLVLDVFEASGDRDGGRPRRSAIDPDALPRLLLPAGGDNGDRAALELVTALPPTAPGRKPRGRRPRGAIDPGRLERFRLPPSLYESVLQHLSSEEVLAWWDGRTRPDGVPLFWDAGSPWRLTLRLEPATAAKLRLVGRLEREEESVPMSDALLILPPVGNGGGDPTSLVLFAETIGRLDATTDRDLPWIDLLGKAGDVLIPKEELEEALTTLLEIPTLPRLEIPEELQLTEESSPPKPRLVLEQNPLTKWENAPLAAELSFGYGELEISVEDPRPVIVNWAKQHVLRRDMKREHAALVRVLELGVRPVESAQGHELELAAAQIPKVAEPLLSEGWSVEVRGTSLRAPNPPALRVDSGIDWFELSGQMDFDIDSVELATVLDAIGRGDRFVKLKDGSQGLLPESWVETYGSLTQLAHGTSEEGLRFLPSQALLVDALLAATPPRDVDRAFAELREKLLSFESIKPKKEPRGFGGTLRGYQRQGLGWLTFLREFGLGGILADDMGLGKTVQVLALLRAQRTPSKTTGLPSLVVAPRSLVYNWMDEAERFTPSLEIVEYGGPGREALQDKLGEYDVVVTTYGTLRRDVGFLATVEFDTVVLDEAQAIKNRESQAAKASRLLVARNRLALTGTPIENHLGELGSIFEFLNPGLLGKLPWLDVLSGGHQASRSELEMLAQGIRPFVLRRTKKQVLPDLPPKTEQVLLCDLNPRQRELYDQLRATYQASLLQQIEESGPSSSAIQVLEALLRLRQTACHPGLVDESWAEAGSAKLDALFEHVDEVLDEGHKLVIFSQFTKLLGFVRRHFDAENVEYAYLDGQTRNRGEVVERFQTDAGCNLFLISLKAGGLGLNLTAAEYVFLLDPWWNPAVEAQAIDRAHRIGQTQPVFAYRMIARDTVEEKILELQRSKKKIADAIFDGEGQSLRDLTADDLRMLLS